MEVFIVPIEDRNRVLRSGNIVQKVSKILVSLAGIGLTRGVCNPILITPSLLLLWANLFGYTSYSVSNLFSQFRYTSNSQRISCSRYRRSLFGALLDGGVLLGSTGLRLLSSALTPHHRGCHLCDLVHRSFGFIPHNATLSV